MALEKWLLEYAKIASPEELEKKCKYLIENSKSASITAVVTSTVLAQPYKLFNIAKIFFQTKEFFLYDNARWILEQDVKGLYSMGYGLGSYKDKIYRNERIGTCSNEHRKMALEHLALKYQIFKSEENNDFEKQREVLWKIWDKYYEKLPPELDQLRPDKTWRLYLARMDSRKMTPSIEPNKEGEGTLITFNPKIDTKLKKYIEDSLQKISDEMKYTSLRLWAIFRFEKNEDKYKQYQQYENDPQLVITETKEIIKGLKNKDKDNFFLFNHSIPAYSCSVLIRDFFDSLNVKEKEFCKKIILEYASLPLQKNYQYKNNDGVKAAVNILPFLLKSFVQDSGKIKKILLLILFDSHPIGINQRLADYSISTILYNLWKTYFKDAHSIFLGYLLLKPRYDSLRDKLLKESRKKNIYKLSEEQVSKSFIKQYDKELENIISDKITYEDLGSLNQLSLNILNTAFELLPPKTENGDHKKFLNTIFPVFSKKLFVDDDRIDYSLKHRFLEKFAYFVLTSSREELETYLKPFVEDFSNSRNMADFFQEFISVEDRLNQYEEFWIVWNAFYGKIVDLCKDSKLRYYANEIIHNYLLACQDWKKNAREWHTLKEKEKLFYKKVSQDMGHCPAVLYSISKVLNDIGSNFLEDGIFWLSNILQKNKNLSSEKLEINTIFYIENIVRKYILTNRRKIKKILKIKKDIVIILNFLIERGSVTRYLLREDIL
jgi:hypothetical protein